MDINLSNKEKVLHKLSTNKFLGKTPIRFRPPNRFDYFSTYHYDQDVRNFENVIDKLKAHTDVVSRVFNIIETSRHHATQYPNNNRFQCRGGARRTACDIWRLYKYYFDENVDIFTIMRALHAVVMEYSVNTYRCPDIRRRVFWVDGYTVKDFEAKAELGVPFSEWKTIGLEE